MRSIGGVQFYLENVNVISKQIVRGTFIKWGNFYILEYIFYNIMGNEFIKKNEKCIAGIILSSLLLLVIALTGIIVRNILIVDFFDESSKIEKREEEVFDDIFKIVNLDKEQDKKVE